MNAMRATREIAPIEAVMIGRTLILHRPDLHRLVEQLRHRDPAGTHGHGLTERALDQLATANDVKSSDTKLAFRSGRKATSSIRTEASLPRSPRPGRRR